MFATITNGANDTTGVSAFGRMWRRMITRSRSPFDHAVRTYREIDELLPGPAPK